MAKQHHFTNSKVSSNLFEPLYSNLFEVTITPPEILTNSPEWGSQRELVLEEVKSVSGLDVDKLPEIVRQQFKGTQRGFIGVNPQDTAIEVSMGFEMNLNETNQNFVYNALRAWSDLCYNPLTGSQTLKKDYTSKVGMTIVAFNKNREVYRKYEIKNIFPSRPIPAFPFDYNNNQPLTLEIGWFGDYFTQAVK